METDNNQQAAGSSAATCSLDLIRKDWADARTEYNRMNKRYREAIRNGDRVDWINDEISYAKGKRDALAKIIKANKENSHP